MSIKSKEKILEEQYIDRKLSLDEYISIYKKKTNIDNEINIRQSYNRYKSVTIAKPSIYTSFSTNKIPKDVSNIILSKSTKYKAYNRSSYYDKARVEEIKKKCDRYITLSEFKELQKDVTENKETRKLLSSNILIVYPVNSHNNTRIFYVNKDKPFTISSDSEIVSQRLNNEGYTYTLLSIEPVEGLSLLEYIKPLNNLRYGGSIVSLPLYRYFLKKRTLCSNVVDIDYINKQIIKMVKENTNKYLKDIEILFIINYDILLTLDYNQYYITGELINEVLEEYNQDVEEGKELDNISFLSNILKSLVSLVYFFYVIGIYDFEDRLEEDKIGLIARINNMNGDYEELLNLVNIHLYTIIFGLRIAIDRNLYTSDDIGSGLVSTLELREGFIAYLSEKSEYYK